MKKKVSKERISDLWGLVRRILPLQTTSRGKGMLRENWLEKLDSNHRHRNYLNKEFLEWEKSNNEIGNFFNWLNKKEFSIDKKALQEKIKYVSELEKKDYKVSFNKITGKAYQNGKLFDTMNFPDIKSTLTGFAIFVIDLKKNFLAGQKVRSHFQHSSFTKGNRIKASGIVKFKEGRMISLMQYSGHYHPEENEFKRTLENIPDICLDNVQIATYRFEKRPYILKILKKRLKNSKIKVKVFYLNNEESEIIEVTNSNIKNISKSMSLDF